MDFQFLQNGIKQLQKEITAIGEDASLASLKAYFVEAKVILKKGSVIVAVI